MRKDPGAKIVVIAAASVLLTGVALWSCRNMIRTAWKSAGDVRDSRWLRQHPIDYA
ncbi:MAG: hypothetical protein JO061_21265 [Acidobacteriaceae bacterium]|nr:hypothetical protein [Acidobacteriaceae bacterium]